MLPLFCFWVWTSMTNIHDRHSFSSFSSSCVTNLFLTSLCGPFKRKKTIFPSVQVKCLPYMIFEMVKPAKHRLTSRRHFNEKIFSLSQAEDVCQAHVCIVANRQTFCKARLFQVFVIQRLFLRQRVYSRNGHSRTKMPFTCFSE